jgi:indole-3-glycerol phosphate synthase
MILDDILSHSAKELAQRKLRQPLKELRRITPEAPPPLDFASALRGERIRLIAEFKKASPSKGIIRAEANPGEIARAYTDSGAAAISVLTEARYFQGSLDHLVTIKKTLGNQMPLLRKDFIFDPYQVYESRAYGADALLLIVAMLTEEKLKELLKLSHELGMSCLVEVHNEADVATALAAGAGIIGINNRDLRISTTERLRPLIPRDRIVVAESGLRERRDVEKMEKLGVDVVLIGEALMTAPDITARIRELF